MRATLTILLGLVLLASAAWLASGEHAVAFGVGPDAWFKDLIAGLLLVGVGAVARAGQRRDGS
jgi:hypothetical protein